MTNRPTVSRESKTTWSCITLLVFESIGTNSGPHAAGSDDVVDQETVLQNRPSGLGEVGFVSMTGTSRRLGRPVCSRGL